MKNALTIALAILRRVVGVTLFIIGVLGLLLPILPGWPLIIPAVVLLGRRDKIIRHTHLIVRHALRFMRRSEQTWLRRIGMRLSLEYVRTRRVVVPAIDATERAFARAWFAS
ncbi:MAG: hypothetical protein RLZZ387_3102 [Chloroflexota bacterium]|jgi:uncharacterized membrane protein YbaN (DUF454 family)